MIHGGDIYRNKVKIDFSVNTNPFGMPNAVRKALARAGDMAHCYPDPDQEELRGEIAARYQVKPDEIVCGNGASELFLAIAHAKKPKEALLIAPGFYGYEQSLQAVDCNLHFYRLREEDGFALTEDVISSMVKEIDLMYLACPNNPTGRVISPKLFLRLMDEAVQKHIFVVMDLCFFELIDWSCRKLWIEASLDYASLIDRYYNLILVNAFTKTMAMAGVRIGFSMCKDEELNEELRKHLPEWNLNVFAQEAGIAAARENSFVCDSVLNIEKEKAYLYQKLRALGVKVYESDVNFLLLYVSPAQIKHKTGNLAKQLLEEFGILIRDCSNFEGLREGFYRIAVRTGKDNEILIQALQIILSQKSGEKNEAMTDEMIQNVIEHVLPSDIEKNSMLTISKELEWMGIALDSIQAPVIKRCIHTAADFDYAKTLRFSEDAIRIAEELIRKGADIVTDTNMGLSGINKKELEKYGGKVHCFMADEDVALLAKQRGVTRATISMEKASQIKKPVIFAIGNAPTALIELHKMMTEGSYRPAFIIGVPVGFVNVVASKELIMQSEVPYIVNEGRKGGSNVAAAICNALLYDLRDKGE